MIDDGACKNWEIFETKIHIKIEIVKEIELKISFHVLKCETLSRNIFNIDIWNSVDESKHNTKNNKK